MLYYETKTFMQRNQAHNELDTTANAVNGNNHDAYPTPGPSAFQTVLGTEMQPVIPSTLFDPVPCQLLTKHTAAVLNVVFTKTGTHCLTTSQDKSIVLWNPLKGLAIKQYTGSHNHEVNDVSIAQDNSTFVSVGGDKAAFLWDVTTGNVVRKFPGHNGKIHACALTCNDTVLWTGGYDKVVRIFDVRSQLKPIQMLNDAKDAVSSFLAVKDSRMLVTSTDGCTRCYDIRQGRCTVDRFSAPLLRGGLTHDDRCYVIAGLDDCIRLVELETGEVLNTFRGHKNSSYMLNAQFTPDDSYVVSASEDGLIYIWDICSRPISDIKTCCSQILNAHGDTAENHTPVRGCVFTVRFHPEQWIMLSCHNDSILRVWKRAEKD